MAKHPDESKVDTTNDDGRQHPFDQTNGVVGEDTSPAHDHRLGSDAERARGAALGAAMPAGWGR